MLFKLHYWLLTAGANALSLLMGVYMETYTDASAFELGALFMLMPFTGIVFRPIICAMADREQAHQKYLLLCLTLEAMSFAPFIIVPFIGPSLYEQHPRACWYSLVSLKILGDIAFGGVVSIGDSLAINYSRRIGTDFSVYRVWGTLAWMSFGLIIGQINEVWFLPKYVPGFLILLTCNILHIMVVWIWPPEYFIMVAMTPGLEENKFEKEETSKNESEDDKPKKKENPFMKSLMPREYVINHMKGKLIWLLCCSGNGNRSVYKSNNPNLGWDGKLPLEGQSTPSIIINGPVVVSTTTPQPDPQIRKTVDQIKRRKVDKVTQFKILTMLFRRDLRITLYLLFFASIGAGMACLSFFVMSLSHICHTEGTCEFSPLVGMLQASMAGAETILFVFVKRIKTKIGRVNLCALGLLLFSVKYLFYGTLWANVSPYYSLITETLHGIVFGIQLTLMVEVGHLFANEVEFILPELMAKGTIKEDADSEQLKLSLSATMQAIIACACDGIGRGFGALIYGTILEFVSYETLWLIVGVFTTTAFAITITISVLDKIFKFELGLDVQAAKKRRQLNTGAQATISAV